ncbi:sensor histidine kinase regulating citrate/malate metabolism [Metabacillus crassostreae]|nr:sensor histidine kinase regulating citrate/malate metabolism [Metabacillus crassostreae]
MWMMIGIISVGLVIVMAEVPSLIRKQEKKQLWVFAILLILGVGLSIAKTLNVHIPNPIDALIFFYQPISDVVMTWLS